MGRGAVRVSQAEIEHVVGTLLRLQPGALLEHLPDPGSLPDRIADLGGYGHDLSLRCRLFPGWRRDTSRYGRADGFFKGVGEEERSTLVGSNDGSGKNRKRGKYGENAACYPCGSHPCCGCRGFRLCKRKSSDPAGGPGAPREEGSREGDRGFPRGRRTRFHLRGRPLLRGRTRFRPCPNDRLEEGPWQGDAGPDRRRSEGEGGARRPRVRRVVGPRGRGREGLGGRGAGPRRCRENRIAAGVLAPPHEAPAGRPEEQPPAEGGKEGK